MLKRGPRNGSRKGAWLCPVPFQRCFCHVSRSSPSTVKDCSQQDSSEMSVHGDKIAGSRRHGLPFDNGCCPDADFSPASRASLGITNLSLLASNGRYITVAWDRPEGDFDFYWLDVAVGSDDANGTQVQKYRAGPCGDGTFIRVEQTQVTCGPFDACSSVAVTVGTFSKGPPEMTSVGSTLKDVFIGGQGEPRNIRISANAPYTTQILWEPPESVDGILDSYKVKVCEKLTTCDEDLLECLEQEVSDAWLDFNSTGDTSYCVLHCPDVTNLNLVAADNHYVTVAWDRPRFSFDYYWLDVTGGNGSASGNLQRHSATACANGTIVRPEQTRITCGPFDSCSTVDVTVRTHSKGPSELYSMGATLRDIFVDGQDPSEPRSITTLAKSASATRLQWGAPSSLHGILDKYVVKVCEAVGTCDQGHNSSGCVEYEASDTWLDINSTEGTLYCVVVTAEVRCGRNVLTSRPATQEVRTPFFGLPDVSNLTVAGVESGYVTLSWLRPQGRFDYYSVEVSEEGATSKSTPEQRHRLCANGAIIRPDQGDVTCGPFEACTNLSLNPNPPTNVTMIPESPSRTRLHWGRPVKVSGIIESYIVKICSSFGSCDQAERLSDCAEHQTTEMWTVFDSKVDTSYCALITAKIRCGVDEVRSRHVAAEVRTPLFDLPDVTDLRLVSAAGNSITVAWEKPESRFDYYWVSIAREEDRQRGGDERAAESCENGTIIHPDQTQVTCTKLNSCSRVSVAIRVHRNGPPERTSRGVLLQDIFIPGEEANMSNCTEVETHETWLDFHSSADTRYCVEVSTTSQCGDYVLTGRPAAAEIWTPLLGPSEPKNITTLAISPSTTRLQWEAPSSLHGVLHSYRVEVCETSASCETKKNASECAVYETSDRWVDVNSTADTLYCVVVTALARCGRNVLSGLPATKEVRTPLFALPDVTNLSVAAVDDLYVTMTWDRPRFSFDYYWIDVAGVSDSKNGSLQKHTANACANGTIVRPEQTEVTCGPFDSCSSVDVTVRTYKKGPPELISTGATLRDVFIDGQGPSEPRSITMSAESPPMTRFQWEAPTRVHGTLDMYRVKVCEASVSCDQKQNVSDCLEYETSDTWLDVNSTADTPYCVIVTAVARCNRNLLSSLPATKQVRTPLLGLPDVSNLEVEGVESGYVTLSWQRPGGRFDYYSVEVTEEGDTSKSTSQGRHRLCANGTIIRADQTEVTCGPFEACTNLSCTVRTHLSGPPEHRSLGVTATDIFIPAEDPSPATNVTAIPESPSRTRLRWGRPEDSGITGSYSVKICSRFGLCDPAERLSECAEHQTTETWTVFNSKADTSYCVLISAKIRCGMDEIISRHVATEIRTPLFDLPDASDLRLVSAADNSITVAWEKPEARFDYYWLSVAVEDDEQHGADENAIVGSCKNGTIIHPDQTRITCTNLKACTRVNVTLRAHRNGPPERTSRGVCLQDIFIVGEEHDPPKNLTVLGKTPSLTHLQWEPPTKVSGRFRVYTVKICDTYESCAVEANATGCVEARTNESWLDFQSTVDTEYCVVISTNSQCGENVLTGQPHPPRNVTMVPQSSSLTQLHWERPDSMSVAVESYSVNICRTFRKCDQAERLTHCKEQVTSQTWTEFNSTEDTPYCVLIAAKTRCGTDEIWSRPAVVELRSPILEIADVSNLTIVRIENGYVTLSWQRPCGRFDYYTVEAFEDEAGTGEIDSQKLGLCSRDIMVHSNVTQVTCGPLEPCTKWYCTVRTHLNGPLGRSSSGATVKDIFIPGKEPQPPKNVTMIPQSSSRTQLHWEHPDNVSVAVEYYGVKICRTFTKCDRTEHLRDCKEQVTSQTWVKLDSDEDTPYCILVTAKTHCGIDEISSQPATAAIRTPVFELPDVSNLTSVGVENGYVMLSWQRPRGRFDYYSVEVIEAQAGGKKADKRGLGLCAANGTILRPDQTQVTCGPFGPCSKLSCTVRTHLNGPPGLTSSGVTVKDIVIPATEPRPPRNVKLVPQSSSSTQLHWEHPDDASVTIESYNVKICRTFRTCDKGENLSDCTEDGTSETSVTFDSTADTPYCALVTAMIRCEMDEIWSGTAVAKLRTPIFELPDVSDLTTAGVQNGYITLSWQRPRGRFDYYSIEAIGDDVGRKIDKRGLGLCANGTILRPDQTQVTCGPFKPCTKLSCIVRTHLSGPPERVSVGVTLKDIFVPAEEPRPPGNVTMVAQSSSLTQLHWEHPNDASVTTESYVVKTCRTFRTCDETGHLSDCKEQVTSQTWVQFDSTDDTSYCVLVTAIAHCGEDELRSRPAVSRIRTPIFELHDVSNLTAVGVKNGYVTLSWQRPRGRFDYYSVVAFHNGVGSKVIDKHGLGLCANGTIVHPDQTQVTCGPFEPCSKLSCTVRTHLNGPLERISSGARVKDIFIPAEAPRPPRNVAIIPQSASRTQLHWVHPDDAPVANESYHVKICRTLSMCEQAEHLSGCKEHVTSHTWASFDSAEDSRYCVLVTSITRCGTDEIKSQPAVAEIRTPIFELADVSNLMVLRIKNGYVTLSWQRPRGRFDYYTVQAIEGDIGNKKIDRQGLGLCAKGTIVRSDQTQVTCGPFEPCTKLSCTLRTHLSGLRERSSSGVTVKDIFVPAAEQHPPRNVTMTPLSSSLTRLNWEHPDNMPVPVHRYSVRICRKFTKCDRAQNTSDCEDHVTPHTWVKFDTTGYTPYCVLVMAVTLCGNHIIRSRPAVAEIRTPIFELPDVSNLMPLGIKNGYVTLFWRRPRGRFDYYSIEAVEDDVRNKKTDKRGLGLCANGTIVHPDLTQVTCGPFESCSMLSFTLRTHLNGPPGLSSSGLTVRDIFIPAGDNKDVPVESYNVKICRTFAKCDRAQNVSDCGDHMTSQTWLTFDSTDDTPYCVLVTAMAHCGTDEIRSRPAVAEIRTPLFGAPDVTNLHLVSVGTDSFTAAWDRPKVGFDYYWIERTSTNNVGLTPVVVGSCINGTTVPPDQTQVTCTHYDPCSNAGFKIRTHISGPRVRDSPGVSLKEILYPSKAPPRVVDLKLETINARHFTVTYKTPKECFNDVVVSLQPAKKRAKAKSGRCSVRKERDRVRATCQITIACGKVRVAVRTKRIGPSLRWSPWVTSKEIDTSRRC
ncbi:hypothetical protein HPB50_011498 [Hyalomma asiaticum]|uniref:Uncharacterized protein n=1 Tax=Hyalomma asiaticum TaxID=266040 RepID=A0ACB7RWN9_HYAAI|nr:hypothetical protein HPB50_011498 [Hyalomma asiaticum]